MNRKVNSTAEIIDDQGLPPSLVDEKPEAGGVSPAASSGGKRRPDYWVGLVHIDGDKAWTMRLIGDEFRPVSMPAKTFLENHYGKKPAPATPQNAPVTPPVKQKPVSKVVNKEITTPVKKQMGRPKAVSNVDTVSKILNMSKTMSSRSIAKELNNGGTSIGHVTVTRIIKGQRQLL